MAGWQNETRVMICCHSAIVMDILYNGITILLIMLFYVIILVKYVAIKCRFLFFFINLIIVKGELIL